MGRGGLLGAAMIGFAGAIGVALVTAAGLGLTTALGLALAATGVGAAFVALALFVDEFAATVGDADALALFVGKLAAVVGDAGALALFVGFVALFVDAVVALFVDEFAAAVGDADALALFVGKLAAVVGDAGALAPFVAEFAAAVGDAGAAFALALFVGFVALFVDEFAAAVGDAGAAVGVAVGPSANAEAGDSKVITIAKVSHTVKERIRCIKTAGQRKIKNRLAIVLRSVTPLAPSGLGVQVSNRPEINAPACVSCHCEEAVCADEAIPMLLGRFAASLRSQ